MGHDGGRRTTHFTELFSTTEFMHSFVPLPCVSMFFLTCFPGTEIVKIVPSRIHLRNAHCCLMMLLPDCMFNLFGRRSGMRNEQEDTTPSRRLRSLDTPKNPWHQDTLHAIAFILRRNRQTAPMGVFRLEIEIKSLPVRSHPLGPPARCPCTTFFEGGFSY